jgi:hypothetical protein
MSPLSKAHQSLRLRLSRKKATDKIPEQNPEPVRSLKNPKLINIDNAHNGLPDLTAFQKVEASDAIGNKSGSRKPRYGAAGSITGKALGWKNAISSPNEANPNSGGRRCSHGSRVLALREPDF